MSLLDRLSGAEQPKLPVHQFWASMVQYARGRITEDALKTVCLISGGTDLTEWNWLKAKYLASTDKVRFLESMQVLFMLAEIQWYGYADHATMVAEINALA